MTTVSLIAAVIAALALQGNIVDELTYKQIARETANRKFLAKLDEGHAKLKVARARQKVTRTDDLFRRNAASFYDQSAAQIELIQAGFEEKRAHYHVQEAELVERLWRLRARWSRPGQRPQPRELAQLNLDLRRERLAIIRHLVADSERFQNQFEQRYTRAVQLRQGRAIAAEDFEAIEIFKDQAVGLAEEATREARRAQEELTEAEADLRALPTEPMPTRP